MHHYIRPPLDYFSTPERSLSSRLVYQREARLTYPVLWNDTSDGRASKLRSSPLEIIAARYWAAHKRFRRTTFLKVSALVCPQTCIMSHVYGLYLIRRKISGNKRTKTQSVRRLRKTNLELFRWGRAGYHIRCQQWQESSATGCR